MVFSQTKFGWKPLLFICLVVLILVLLLWTKLSFEMSSQTPTEMSNQTPTEMSSQTPTEMSSQAPTEMSSQTPTEMSSQTPTEMSSQTPTNQLSLSRVEHVIKPSCQNVLDNMVLGRWVKDKQKETEIAAMREFHRKIRLHFGIPQTLQRKDNRCGNVNLEGRGKRGTALFRALCDPDGSTPCCFKNKCVLKEIENCRCQDCYDLRQKLHAELSTWIPASSTCKPNYKMMCQPGKVNPVKKCLKKSNVSAERCKYRSSAVNRHNAITSKTTTQTNEEEEEMICQNVLLFCYILFGATLSYLMFRLLSIANYQITKFIGSDDACKVLRHLTIYFIGDSFLRQLYIAVFSLMRNNKPDGILLNNTAPDKRQHCDRYFAQHADCASWIPYNARECNNTVRLRYVAFWKPSQVNEILGYIEELQRQPDSIIVIGYGLHLKFNVPVIENKILNPLLQTLARSPWPKPIWLTPHSPGLLKSPSYAGQQKENTVRYNLKVNDIMKKRGIPVLDFFKMTEDVMSLDGTHYGIGVNDLKAQVLFNYILEIRSNA